MKYYVTIFRKKEVDAERFRNDTGQRRFFYRIEQPFHNREFFQLTKKQKKRFIEGFLNQVTRDKIRSNQKFKPKEKVLVNKTGYWEKKNALFNGKVKIPKHLRKPLQVNPNG